MAVGISKREGSSPGGNRGGVLTPVSRRAGCISGYRIANLELQQIVDSMIPRLEGGREEEKDAGVSVVREERIFVFPI